MKKHSRLRMAIAAGLLAAVSLTTVGATAVANDARRSGDLWCC